MYMVKLKKLPVSDSKYAQDLDGCLPLLINNVDYPHHLSWERVVARLGAVHLRYPE
jgi:hypothetical protein